jgi:hypothetical protein
VDQGKLDARPVNAIAVVGVAIAFGLTLWTARRGTAGRLERRPADPARLLGVVVLVALGLPWMAADLGFSFDGVPVLGTLHGHHHGMDGMLLVATALVLSRLVPAVRSRALRGLAAATWR